MADGRRRARHRHGGTSAGQGKTCCVPLTPEAGRVIDALVLEEPIPGLASRSHRRKRQGKKRYLTRGYLEEFTNH
jgi:hypothetical protein